MYYYIKDQDIGWGDVGVGVLLLALFIFAGLIIKLFDD